MATSMATGPLTSLNVLGLNSGTSMDGIDAGLFKITPLSGDRPADGKCPALKVELISSELIAFQDDLKCALEALVAGKQTDLRTICLVNSALGQVFGAAASKVVEQSRKNGIDVDLIGSHGQTLWHEPVSSKFWGVDTAGTLQLGDPAYVAALSGVTTVGDFRTYDMAFGGQGAPLVSFADEVLFGHDGEPVGVLNLGGIANITVVKDGVSVMAFDTGPASVLIDEAMRILYQLEYDKDGQIAASGQVIEAFVEQFLSQPYFKLTPPKSTGRELFGRAMAQELVQNWRSQNIAAADIVATLTAITARSIAQSYRDFIAPQVALSKIVLGGGGAYNATLIKQLKAYWPGPLVLAEHEDFGVSAKFKEALLFALLAYTTYFGIPNNVPLCTGATRRVCLGKIVSAN
jgi:anhydro-N-acetylmuramic acid kinase